MKVLMTAYDYRDLARAAAGSHTLKERGNGWWQTCCPFHPDKNPSFFINIHSGGFRCHGLTCGVKGGPFTLKRMLGNQGIVVGTLPNETVHENQGFKPTKQHRAVFLYIMEAYSSCYEAPEGAEARTYLEGERKLTPSAFEPLGIRIGYSPSPRFIREYVPRRHIPLLQDYGIARDSGDDVFHNRLIMWSDRYGWAQARALDPRTLTRYLNTKNEPKPLFMPPDHGMFGLTEGLMDGATLTLYGLPACVINGGADLKTLYLKLQPRIEAGECIPGFDADMQGVEWNALFKGPCDCSFDLGGYKDINKAHQMGVFCLR